MLVLGKTVTSTDICAFRVDHIDPNAVNTGTTATTQADPFGGAPAAGPSSVSSPDPMASKQQPGQF
jgi:hypothetical protein